MTIPAKAYFSRKEVLALTGLTRKSLPAAAVAVKAEPVLLPGHVKKHHWPHEAVRKIVEAHVVVQPC